MKKLIFTTILILTMSVLGYTQSVFPELDKAKEIRLLQSTRKDVKRILKGFERDKDENDDYTQTFSTENADIEITFSDGETCGEEDSEKVWNVSEWKVIRIEISPNIPLRFEDLGIDISSFRKEQKYSDVKDVFVYHNKDLGIAFEVDEKDVVEDEDEESSENGEENVVEGDEYKVEEDNENEVDEDKIETIIIFPPNGNEALLCYNEEGENLKQFYSQESYFSKPLEDRIGYGCYNAPPTVDDVVLNKTTIIIGCGNAAESCSDDSKNISVITVTTDKENDPLTFQYQITGGKIVGVGAKVLWDLTDVAPGSYTITVGANDGCGICSPTKTQTVVVEECDDCLPK